MRELRQAIERMGSGEGDVVRVGSFLNHRVDTGLLFEMGGEIARHFRQDAPDLVMTVEASGIALAVAAAHALGSLPVLFAKKAEASNQAGGQLSVPVSSFTHGNRYRMRCERDCLPQGSRVLIVDDFLADGEAARGLMALCELAGATVVGVAVAIEKGFQKGGRLLRQQGVKVLSLSVVREIRDGKILLSDD